MKSGLGPRLDLSNSVHGAERRSLDGVEMASVVLTDMGRLSRNRRFMALSGQFQEKPNELISTGQYGHFCGAKAIK